MNGIEISDEEIEMLLNIFSSETIQSFFNRGCEVAKRQKRQVRQIF